MVRQGIIGYGTESELVIEARSNTPRHEFVPLEYLGQAYANHPLAKAGMLGAPDSGIVLVTSSMIADMNPSGHLKDRISRILIRVFTFSILLFVLVSCSAPMEPGASPGAQETVIVSTVQAIRSEDEPGVVERPMATETPTREAIIAPSFSNANGRVERVEYSSPIVGEYIPVLVYLPPCYSEEEQYPALYLLHGKPQDENHWLILGVDQIVDRMQADGKMAGLIIVMPEQPEPLFSQTDGGPGSYEGEFLSTLIPFIEARYQVDARPERRAVAGISRGGVWALEIGFTHPDLFEGAGALSPALNVNEARPEFDPLMLAESSDHFPERIFLASGDVDSAAIDTERLHVSLSRRGVEHRYTTAAGGHEGGTWEQFLGEMLIYLTQGWH